MPMNILVTIGGECFEAAYIDVGNADGRDGVLYYFKLKDLVKDRGLRNVILPHARALRSPPRLGRDPCQNAP